MLSRKELQQNRLRPVWHTHLPVVAVAVEDKELFSSLEKQDEFWAEAVRVEVAQIPLRSTRSKPLLRM
jgi:hypothetical protein